MFRQPPYSRNQGTRNSKYNINCKIPHQSSLKFRLGEISKNELQYVIKLYHTKEKTKFSTEHRTNQFFTKTMILQQIPHYQILTELKEIASQIILATSGSIIMQTL